MRIYLLLVGVVQMSVFLKSGERHWVGMMYKGDLILKSKEGERSSPPDYDCFPIPSRSYLPYSVPLTCHCQPTLPEAAATSAQASGRRMRDRRTSQLRFQRLRGRKDPPLRSTPNITFGICCTAPLHKEATGLSST